MSAVVARSTLVKSGILMFPDLVHRGKPSSAVRGARAGRLPFARCGPSCRLVAQCRLARSRQARRGCPGKAPAKPGFRFALVRRRRYRQRYSGWRSGSQSSGGSAFASFRVAQPSERLLPVPSAAVLCSLQVVGSWSSCVIVPRIGGRIGLVPE